MHIPLLRTIKKYYGLEKLKKEIHKSKWNFSEKRIEMIFNEYEEWKKYYLPINIKDKIVLDIGAGEGETAKFFLENGAKIVICIECNEFRLKYLNENAKNFPIIVLNKKFDIHDLCIYCDFIKMDIEGYEEILLNYKIPKPIVLEIHGMQLIDKFKKDGRFKIEKNENEEWVCFAFA